MLLTTKMSSVARTTQLSTNKQLASLIQRCKLLWYVNSSSLSLSPLQDYINQLPNVDHPEAFGQHANADVASQIIETR